MKRNPFTYDVRSLPEEMFKKRQYRTYKEDRYSSIQERKAARTRMKQGIPAIMQRPRSRTLKWFPSTDVYFSVISSDDPEQLELRGIIRNFEKLMAQSPPKGTWRDCIFVLEPPAEEHHQVTPAMMVHDIAETCREAFGRKNPLLATRDSAYGIPKVAQMNLTSRYGVPLGLNYMFFDDIGQILQDSFAKWAVREHLTVNDFIWADQSSIVLGWLDRLIKNQQKKDLGFDDFGEIVQIVEEFTENVKDPNSKFYLTSRKKHEFVQEINALFETWVEKSKGCLLFFGAIYPMEALYDAYQNGGTLQDLRYHRIF